jgi:hypothetical protein
VTDWSHKFRTVGSQFREAALLNCVEGAREGILDLSDCLHSICFIQGLASDRIQTIVRSRTYQTFDERQRNSVQTRHTGLKEFPRIGVATAENRVTKGRLG